MRLIPLLLLAGCAAPSPTPLPTLDPPLDGEGFQFSMTGVTVPPGEEVWRCAVYPAPVDEPENVHRIHYLQNAGMHHMTISTPGLGILAEEYGEFDCDDIYSADGFMENAISIFGGTGTAEDVMELPDGVAATLPARFDVIHELHYVNTTEEPVELYSYINAYTMPEGLVTDRIYGGQTRDEHIVIPADSEHEEWSRCVFNKDVRVHFLASHTHDLGDTFAIRLFDGETVGEQVYLNEDLHTPAITQYDPPLEIPAGQGFEWTCRWRNPRPEEVGYGLTAEDEMCNMALVFAPFDLTAACEVVQTSDGVLWQP